MRWYLGLCGWLVFALALGCSSTVTPKEGAGTDGGVADRVAKETRPETDTLPPTIADPTLTLKKLADGSVEVRWKKATDDVTLDGELMYRVYFSGDPNIDALEKIETNGTGDGEFKADIDVQLVKNLRADVDFYFNVVVKDKAGRKSLYKMATTSQKKPPGPTKDYQVDVDKRGRAASILLPQAEFDLWNEKKGFQDTTKRQEFTKEIYKKFKDSFDFIFFVMNNKERPTAIPFGQLYKVSNAVEGLGMKIYNYADRYGSAGKLKAVMQLARKDYLLMGPSLHELLHNWANFVLDTKLLISDDQEGPGKPHWGISDVGGQLGGFDRTTFKEKVDGEADKYQGNMPGKKAFGFNSNGGNSLAYSNFELYLMGLIPKEEVKPIRIFSGVRAKQAEFSASGKFYATSMKQLTIDQIIQDKGERKPSFKDAKKSFRVLALMLTPRPLTQQEWDDFDAQIVRFGKHGDEGTPLFNFWEATGGRASLDMENIDKEVK